MEFTLENIANRNILAFAVGRKMFCPDCGHALTVANAVNASTRDRSVTVCGECFDAQILFHGEELLMAEDGIEIIDGRDLV